MAGQFVKYIKILSGGSKPDIVDLGPGKPQIAHRPVVNRPEQKFVNPNLYSIETRKPVPVDLTNEGKIKEGEVLGAVAQAKSEGRQQKREQVRVRTKAERKRQEEGLATTSMRLDEVSGEAYDLDEGPKPTPRPAQPPAVIVGRIPGKPDTSAKPADWSPKFGKRAAAEQKKAEAAGLGSLYNPQETKASVDPDAERRDLEAGEAAFNASQTELFNKIEGNRAKRRSGASLRSINGVTFDIFDKNEEIYRPNKKRNAGTASGTSRDWAARELVFDNDVEEARVIPPAPPKPPVEEDKPTSKRDTSKDYLNQEEEPADKALREGARIAEKNQREKKNRRTRPGIPGGRPRTTGGEVVGQEPILEEPKAYVEGEIPNSAYDEEGNLAPHAQEGIGSTTMREIPAEGPAAQVGSTPIRASRQMVPYVKPPVEDTAAGRKIPGIALDTFANQETDIAQAQAEADRARANRSPKTTTTIADLGKVPARASRERSQEQILADVSKAHARNLKLDSKGKSFHTHSDAVLHTARDMAIKSGMSAEYYMSPAFNQHEFVTKAYVMHATGTHNIRNDENHPLNVYLGKRPLEAKARLATAYKLLRNKERFDESSKLGTGYTYSTEQKNVNLDTDYFRSSSGEHVPMSNLAHPEHPLKNGPMEGSHVPFEGFHKRPDGTYSRISVHQGWHPYDRNIGTKQNPISGRVFEYHNIPSGAIHEADLVTEAIRSGTTIADIHRRLTGGADSKITLGGLNVLPAPGTREAHARATAKKVAEEEEARKKAEAEGKVEPKPKPTPRGAVAATITAPLAGTGRVGIRRPKQDPKTGGPMKDASGNFVYEEKPTVREFTEVESSNLSKIPKSDDSRKPIISLGKDEVQPSGLGTQIIGETPPTKRLKEEKDE